MKKEEDKIQKQFSSVISTPTFVSVNCGGNPGVKDNKRKIDSRFRGNDIVGNGNDIMESENDLT